MPFSKEDEIKSWFQAIRTVHSGYLSEIWLENTRKILEPIILSNEAFSLKLEKILSTILYSVQPESAIISSQAQWHLAVLNEQGINLADLPPSVDDGPVIVDRYVASIDGRRITPDTLNRVHYALEIRKLLKFEKARPVFFELGAGYG